MPKNHFDPSQALDDDDLARLDALFEAVSPDTAMLLEELDGFFTALACSADRLPVTEVVPEVLGLEPGIEPQFASSAQADELHELLQRHLDSVDAALRAGEGFAPILMHDDDGAPGGNLWAIGFLRAMSLQPDSWKAVDDSVELDGVFEPIEALAGEFDEDSGEIRRTMTDEQRKEAVDEMIESAFSLYDYFSPARTPAGASGQRH
ncbi:MAG: YecA family protein [Burkholderiaceae bacterium]